MFRWLQPRTEHKRPSSKSPNILTDLRQHVSHAFAPIFRYTPSHRIRECPYCFERVRHRGDYVKDKIPLEYQNYYHLNGFTYGNLYIIKMDEPESIYPASWGLVPDWAIEDSVNFRKKSNTLNARCETIFEKNSSEK